ncbi:MAG: Wzz/FepE/Etk N-terminal domain-containing protein [Clostridiales bacterium]|nr:Wzz/FepE/Etk N-terminal domain-containing protein [Clostridiales bacterium]
MSTEEVVVNKDSESKFGSDISVVDVINMMLTFWWFIVIFAIFVGGATYTYFKVSSIPEYKSTARIYVNTEGQQTSTDVNASAIAGAANLLPTYIDVLSSKQFLGKVSDDLDNRYSISEIKDMLSLEGVTDTNIISISVKNADAHVSYLVCSSIVNNAPAEISRVFGGGSTKLTEYPEEAKRPEEMHTMRNAAIGLIIGAVIAMLIIFLVNLFDTRVKSKDELIAKYNLPIIGEIPSLD